MPSNPEHDIFEGWSGGGCSGTAPSCSVTITSAQSVTATFGLAPNPPDNTQQSALALGFLECGTGTSYQGATSGGSHGWLVVTLDNIGAVCPGRIEIGSPLNDIAMTVYDSSGQVVTPTAPTLVEPTTSGTYYIEIYSPTASEDSWTLNVTA
jgi:hypothetical protein